MRSADDRRQALASGASAELLVAEALVADGWQVLDRNWSSKAGELDLVVCRGAVLRFVEVKARRSDAMADLDSVDYRKQRKLVATARSWLLLHGDDWNEMAFLVALVNLDTGAITWVDDAFDA